jgi:hypothetical protein
VLGFSNYHSLQVQAAAGCGDYAGADAALEKLSEPMRQVQTSATTLVPVRSVIALRVAGAVLARPASGTGPAGLTGMTYEQFVHLQPLGSPAELLAKEADIRVLRGLLALESGAVETARAHFRAALEVWGSDDQAATGAGLDFPTRAIAQHAMRSLEERDER